MNKLYTFQAFGTYKETGTASAMKQRDYKDATDLVTQPREREREYASGGGCPKCNRGGVSGSLQSSANHNLNSNNVCRDDMIVRRLTPTECERLQGFPDGWTNLGDWVDTKGKKHKEADSPRYKALGNSIALPFWQYLADKIANYDPECKTMGSLFDGIGGFPLVFQRAGIKPVWASEIEEFCIAVTKKHFPEENE